MLLQAPAVKTDSAGPPIEDLKLGQLIVKTRKGRLFRGTYQRNPAAIKVCPHFPGVFFALATDVVAQASPGLLLHPPF